VKKNHFYSALDTSAAAMKASPVSVPSTTISRRCGRSDSNWLSVMADKALFRGKFHGRDQACDGNTLDSIGEDAQASALPEAAAGKTA
jgi:hypothetical protein